MVLAKLIGIAEKKPERYTYCLAVRLADAVFGFDKPRVIDLLCQMLKSPEVEVAIAAAESLDAKDYVTSLGHILEKLLDSVEEVSNTN